MTTAEPTRRTLLRGAILGAAGLGAATTALAATTAPAQAAGIHGQDVSGWQPNIDWPAQKAAGSRFAYCKATEGTGFVSPEFSRQYTASYELGLAHGAYHFARPDQGDPVAQADYFLNNGGGWTNDGRTLPGLLDLEGYHNLPANYGLNQAQMQDWIQKFCNRYREATGRMPMLYSNFYWYTANVGNWAPDGAPLHLAAYQAQPPAKIPAPFTAWDMWQYSSTGPFAGDSNVWHGDEASFEDFLVNPNYKPIGR